MPQVPYQPVPDVAPQNVPTPRLQVSVPPDAFGANIARAIQHLGTTEDQVGNELFSRAQAMQQLRNETDSTEALANYEKKSNDLHVQFSSLEGRNAVAAYPKYSSDQDDLRKSFRDGLPNDMARKMYDRSSLFVMNRALFNGAGHAASENKKAAANSASMAIDAAQDTAGYARTDADFDLQQRRIENQTREQAQMMGLDEDSTRQIVFKNQSRALANRIDQTARRDPVGARQMLDEAIESGRLHSQDRDRVENFVHSHLMSTGARTFVDQNDKDFQDPETFLSRRRTGANVHLNGVDQQFGQNLVAALSAAERATGSTAKVESLARSYEEQAKIRAEHKAMPGGVAAHPAAAPGTSRHEFGQAADLADGPVLEWLRAKDASGSTNASKYGLEFLSGETGQNDPGHIQLAGGASLRRVRAYDIPEKDYVEGAVGRLRMALPNAAPEMEARVRAEALQTYNRNAAYDRQQDQANVNTILETLQGDNAPTTISDLLKAPGAANAWNQLPAKQQEQITRLITKNPVTDINERYRLAGLSTHDETIPDFLKEDIPGNGKLSIADRKHFMDLQNRLRQKAEADPAVSLAFNQIKAQISPDLLADKEAMATFRGALQDQLRLYKQVHATMPKGQDLQDIAINLLQDTTERHNIPQWLGFGGTIFGNRQTRPASPSVFGGSSGPMFQNTPPSDVYRQIRDEWMKQHRGLAPTEEQIQRVWTVDLYQKLYGKPK